MQRLVCDLGIRYPIIEGGMAYIGDGRLAAAVSNAGGLGQVGSAGRSPSDFDAQLRIATQLTSQPLGVNLPIGEHSNPSERVDIIRNHKDRLRAVSISAGNPKPYIPIFKEMGLIVLVLVSTPVQAIKAVEAGADIVIAEGFEAGGHNGPTELTTFTLVPQVCAAVSVPVIAAGGVVDGKGLAAALALGASGVQIGTRLVATIESPAHPGYKQAIVNISGDQTVVIERSVGRVTRVIRSPYVDSILQFEKTLPTNQELYPWIRGDKNGLAALQGDFDHGFAYAGQGSGLIRDLPYVHEVIEQMAQEAQAIMSAWSLNKPLG